MKNFELLPLSDIQMARVKKFAQMHRRYGGIIIDVLAFDEVGMQALIRVIDKKGQLSPEELYKKALEVFQGEVPEDLQLFFTTMTEEDSKYYLTWDHRYVARVHKYFFIWEIQNSAGLILLNPTIPIIHGRMPDNEETSTTKAKKWLKNYLVMHKVEL